MHDDPLPLAATLRVAGDIVATKTTGTGPVPAEDQVEVLRAIHGLDAATDRLHGELAECLGLIDGAGRCEECGRLVLVGAWKLAVHKDGPGCLATIPGVVQVQYVVWAWRNPTGVPVLGNALVRRRLRRERRAKAAMNGQHP